ncbi:GNAT family N-acetyltransferase [Dickeya lacustris]|uniref:GNAT family N-acetyltransferase n=1 Tax=Dickeya lacustris TaxID=2259638 RepID=A0ABY8GAM2_9GAMM|nr:GNAT family N-acetyltransferase [Dickeya lacustris]WFN57006.1 GNAT family N-acetyltransferase [Dickeya lacustris]
MLIRKLTGADLAEFRRIRLEGLQLAPAAFGSRWEQEQAESDDYFLTRLKEQQVWGIFNPNSALSGIAAFYYQKPDEATVCSVYLQARLRGSGAAEQLMKALIHDAREYVSRLSLMVKADNDSAIRLYQKLGFSPVENPLLPHTINTDSIIPNVTTDNNTQRWALALKPRI